jgi:hypothetical protein
LSLPDFEPLAAALLKLPEAQGYRLLGSFMLELAGRHEAGARAPGGPDLEGLSKKLQRLGEEKALLDDSLAATKADLAHRAKQLEAEQQRSQELERILADQRARLQTAQKQVVELEAQLVAKNQQLYQAENRVEELNLKLQRAEVRAGDTSRLDALEDGRRELIVQLEDLRQAHERLRIDKDGIIEQLKADLAAARSESGAGGGEALAALWDRLARNKPPLAPGGLHPPLQAAERLVDAFIELARFVHDFDQAMRPFLASFIRHDSVLARPWDVYARSPGLLDMVREVIDVEHGKPAGVLKMRLLGLRRWTVAAIIGSDTAIESIADELEQHLRGAVGMESDPNRKLREYLREDGHHLFHQHIRELRSQKLADAYSHGG